MELNFKCPVCEANLVVEVEQHDETDPLICFECGTGLDIKETSEGEWFVVEET